MAAILALSFTGATHAGSPPMMGVNLAGAEFAVDPKNGGVPGEYGTHYDYPTVRELDYYKSQGIELIRLPFRWERIQHELNGPLDEKELAYIDGFLDEAEKRGMRVILDMHNFGRYAVDGEFEILGSPKVPRVAFRDVWQKIAAHFKDRDCIWAYDIMNEPYDMGPHTWKDSAQFGVDGVRASDMKHAILLSGDQFSGAHRWLKTGANLIEVVDPAKNVIFQAHQYFDNKNSGEYDESYEGEGAYPTVAVDRMREFVDWCRANKVRGIVGEYGVPHNDPRWLEVLDHGLAYLKENGISGCYWAGGNRWGDYTLRADVRPSNDEAPQMSVLRKYGSGAGTGYRPSFPWYAGVPMPGEKGSFGYSYASEGAVMKADFDDSDPKVGYHRGRGIRLAYTTGLGGEAVAGLNLKGGVEASRNFADGQALVFQARGTKGASLDVSLANVDGAGSRRVNTGPLSDEWREITIPLARFVDSKFSAKKRIQQIVFEGKSSDAAPKVVHVDDVAFEGREAAPPSVTVATSDSASSYAAGASIAALATVKAGGAPVDFVEFVLNGERVGVSKSAPYSTRFSLPSSGTHRLVAIAYDRKGQPARSPVKTLKVDDVTSSSSPGPTPIPTVTPASSP